MKIKDLLNTKEKSVKTCIKEFHKGCKKNAEENAKQAEKKGSYELKLKIAEYQHVMLFKPSRVCVAKFKPRRQNIKRPVKHVEFKNG